MFKIRFRKWVRSKLQAGIKARPRDRGLLDEIPWLEPLLPLGSYLTTEGPNQITFQKVDYSLLFDDHAFNSVYLVQADGTILLKTQGLISVGWWNIRKAEPVREALRRLGEKADQVKYIVVIDSAAWMLLTGWARITLFTFPKHESPTKSVIRLIGERAIETGCKKREAVESAAREYQMGRAEASQQ